VGDDQREGIKLFTNFARTTFSSDKTLVDLIHAEMIIKKIFGEKVDKEEDIGRIRVNPTRNTNIENGGFIVNLVASLSHTSYKHTCWMLLL
jgi:hypothetical protein